MHTVLIVDDNPIELVLTKTLLEQLGFEPCTASSGDDAMQLIRNNSPYMVICDINMPGMSGLDLLKEIQDFVLPPIFIMTGNVDEEDQSVASFQFGAYGYLTKPIKEDLLHQALLKAILRRQKEMDARQERETLIRTDPLTGLPNKDGLLRALAECTGSQRRKGHPLVLLFVNVDGLRYINNTHDHHHGDRVLQHMAANLRKSVRPTDVVARYGGDIFALILTAIDPENACRKAEAILSDIEHAKIQLGSQEHSLTVTIGAALGFSQMPMETLVSNAELALLLAKRGGHNQFYLYRDEDAVHRREFGTQLNKLEILKRAVKGRSFKMHYQPIVHLKTGQPHYFESLIRLHDDAGSVLLPDAFMKVAEDFGLATRIDCMVVTACIQKLVELEMAGNPVCMAINLSGKSLGNADLLILIKRELEETGIDPYRIIFEISEIAAFAKLEQLQQFVREMKRLGCRFALDDFGVGFSSFYHVKQLGIDYLKIDGSFIQNIMGSDNGGVVVQAMVEISRVFDINIIAEWVENAETMALLHEMGVEYGQGYHFGKPEPECDMTLFLR